MPLRHATLRQLNAFSAVARTLSFSAAARELHLTQPAVSIQVRQLEGHAGLPLFEQVGRKVHLTEAGRELQARAAAIARELGAAEQVLDAMRGLATGRVAIALVSTAKYFAPSLLGRFMQAHPGVNLRLAVENREAVIALLAANEVDFAIMGRPPQDLDTVAAAFARHPHVVVAPRGHPLARRRRIPFARLAEETFIVREAGSGTRAVLQRLFAERRQPLKVSMEMASNETIKQAVMAGMGISLLSLHTVGLELATRRLVVLDVAGLPVVRDWHVVHLARKRLSPVAEALKAFLLTEGAKHLEGQQRPRRRAETAR